MTIKVVNKKGVVPTAKQVTINDLGFNVNEGVIHFNYGDNIYSHNIRDTVKTYGDQSISGNKYFLNHCQFQDSLAVNTHKTDHGYISYFTDKDNPAKRTAYVGFGSAGQENFFITNEYGNSQLAITNWSIQVNRFFDSAQSGDGVFYRGLSPRGGFQISLYAGNASFVQTTKEGNVEKNWLNFNKYGGVDLRHNDNIKAQTTDKGFSVTGNVSSSLSPSDSSHLTRKDYVDNRKAVNSDKEGSGFGGFRYTISGSTLNLYTT